MGEKDAMARALEKFNILLCGKKEMMEKLRRLIPESLQTHLRFASSPGFLVGRALFTPPHLVLVDVRVDKPMLRSALKEFIEQYPNTPTLAIAEESDHAYVVDLVKMGVQGYFLFPKDQKKISEQITVLYNDWRARRSKELYAEQQRREFDFRQIVGNSPALRLTLDRARKIIQNNTMTVLITGETGTGKELVARAIHYNSRSSHSQFVDIACTALPETLLESELFGYEKGAFTDAKDRKIGLFELAGDGSIFLDEIGDISLATQSKLLKVIEDRTMRRLGGVKDIPVRARIIAATSADLEGKMRSGEFRKDLFHRLKILPVEIPPLRDRKDDIPLLVEGFLTGFNETYGKHIRGITPQALQVLMDHDWEGNVRELKHAIERAVLLEEGDMIGEADFELGGTRKGSSKKKVIVARAESSSPRDTNSLLLMVPFAQASVAEVQQLLATKVLEYVGGSKVKAARILKISRPRLDRILKAGEDEGWEE
jgi:DNA-binding NtrC family response regulator